jgi:flagellar biosynthesis GTPase FlhF
MAAVNKRGETYHRLIALLSASGRAMTEKSIRDELGVSASVSWKVITQAREDGQVYICKWLRATGTPTGGVMTRMFRFGTRKDAARPGASTNAENQRRSRERKAAAKLTEQNKRDWHAKRDEARRVAREAREKAKLEAAEKAMRDADKAIREAARKAQRETVQRVKAIVAQQPRNPFASLMAQV